MRRALCHVAAAVCAFGCLERSIQLDWKALFYGLGAVAWIAAAREEKPCG